MGQWDHRVHRQRTKGCNRLIQNGAALIEGTDDIIDVLNHIPPLRVMEPSDDYGQPEFDWQGAQNDMAVRQTVRHALEAGATKQHIVETIGQMSVFAGIPAMTRALELAQAVLDEKEGDA